MMGIVLTCAIILISSELHKGISAQKPNMTVVKPYIQEGEELKIICQGEGRLNFTTQKLTGYKQSDFKIFSEAPGMYTFVRSKTTSLDTGWYACAKEGITIRNDEQNTDHSSQDIGWIYVYIKSQQPFAVMDALYDTISVLAGKNAVIPCRPTSAELPVILECNNHEILENIIYQPEIGFILKAVATEYSGSYTCKLNRSDDEDQIFWPSYNLYVQDSVLEIPTINQDSSRHVVLGDDLTLICRLPVSEGLRVTFSWKLPKSIPEERLLYSEYMLTEDRKYFKTKLTVKNVEKGDNGEYICVVTNAFGTQTESNKTIEIWDPRYTYINVSTDSGKFAISLFQGESAQWKVNIDTYPEKFNWEFRKEDGSLMTTEGQSRFSYENSDMNYYFRISNLDIEDSGNYTLRINTSHNATTVTLPLSVEAPPVTNIGKTLLSYQPRQSAIFSCYTSGLPPPNVTWIYMEYPDYPSIKNGVPQFFPDIDKETMAGFRFHFVSQLHLSVNATGNLTCRTCNQINCTESTKTILVSDAVDFFEIAGPKQVVEGDNVTLTCSASRLNFTDNLTWEIPHYGGLQQVVPRDKHVRRIVTNSTTRMVLEIFNITASDSGVYGCRAVCKTTGNKTENYTMVVLDALPPRILETNINNSQIVIKYDPKRDMNLTCLGDGMPNVKVTWYQDNKLLAAGIHNQYEFLESHTKLHIRFFHTTGSVNYSCRVENRLGMIERYIIIEIKGTPENVIWISSIFALIVVIIIVITYMLIKIRREKRLRKLFAAGLTNFQDGAVGSLNPELTIDEQVELLPYDEAWEFPREQLKLGKQLGSGAFGVVLKAEARGIRTDEEVTTVAVKMIQRSADPSYMKALSSELKIMIHLGKHINVVNLLGACTKTIFTKRELFVIVEYCRFGNLHNYLQRHRDSFVDQIDPSTQKIDTKIGMERLGGRTSDGSQSQSKHTAFSFFPSISINSSDSNSGCELVDYRLGQDSGNVNMSPNGGILSNNSVQPGWRSNYRGDYKDHNLKPICTQDLLCWAWQVSRGMEYLSSRNVLHGDLAARNVLLAEGNIVKICDFGLAKNMYKDNNYKKKGDGPLPIKWMAIESIRDRIFSTQSDVWSFGMVLWEFFTLARTPYPGMEAEKQYDRLVQGFRLEKPEYATEEIYDFMLSCWQAKPSARPSFSELVERIGNLLNERIRMHYLDLNITYMNMNTIALQNGQSDYLTMMSAPNHIYYNSPSPMVEMRTDSAYVSMNRFKKSSQCSTSTSHTNLEKSHFNFPPYQNVRLNSDPDDCDASDPMLMIEHLDKTPVDAQKIETDLINHSEKQNENVKESGYCNLTNNPHFSNMGNRSFVDGNNSDQNTHKTELRINYSKDDSPPLVSADDNHISPTKQSMDLLKGRPTDSFSNPCYVIMSKNKL